MDLLKNKKSLYIIISGCIGIICIIICLVIENSSNTNKNTYMVEENIVSTEIQPEKNTQEKNEIIIHIAGEVNNPGIIKITEGSRLVDAVEMAGGFTKEADVSKVNLAYEVQDEQKIVIPNVNNKDEEVKIIDDNEDFIVSDNSTSGGLVNINTATQSELESLTGIGPSMASKIIDYRNNNGKFSTKEDIKNVPGIGNSKYESIKDEICIK